MKTKKIIAPFLGCFLVCTSFSAFAFSATANIYENDTIVYPTNPAETNEIFTFVEQQPEFPGGKEAFDEYLKNNLVFPEEALKKGIQGTMYVTFTVEKDGSISNIGTLGELGYGCNEESVRLIKSGPNWIPGKQNTYEVRVRMTVPISFYLPQKK